MLLNDRRATTESRSLNSAESQVSGQGMASLVLGTFAVAVSFLPVLGLPALVLGPLAIILAYFARTGQPRDRVTGTAGLILGITGTVVALIVTAITIYGVAQYTEKFRSFPFAAAAQAPAASAKTGAPGAGRTAANSVPTHKAPSVSTTGEPPGKPCGQTVPGGAQRGQSVTFIIEGEPGKTFNVNYGAPIEYRCVEGATGRWEATMLVDDPKGAIISSWYDGGSEKNLTCQIIVDGQVVVRGQNGACTT